MIVFDLRCTDAHVFEAWFGSTGDYEAQLGRGLIECPICGDSGIAKAVMAPAVPSKGNRAVTPSPMQVKAALATLAKAQASVEANCDYVGGDFASEARSMHEGETPQRGIYGEATRAEAASLVADGVPVAPLLFRPRARSDA
ncbi:DUF1178 family protein [Glacieibacterium sp.]|uniref:DUF1178 family protein n=1 Tax=Glacieibacterium sp. TaxID=2860237 RepID=UPI003B01006E